MDIPLPTPVGHERVHMTKYLPISERRMDLLREATARDDVMNELKEVILQGWPQSKDQVPSSALPYFPYRDELTVYDGLVIRGQRVVILTVNARGSQGETALFSHWN